MREKYKVEGDTVFFGIRYDKRTGKLFVGCQRKFTEEVESVLESYFLDQRKAVMAPNGSRVVWRTRIGLDCWTRGIRNLKNDFTVEETRNFGRLTR